MLLLNHKVHEFDEHCPILVTRIKKTDEEQFVMHWHTDLKLFLVKKGQCSIKINNETIIARSGKVIVINCNWIHKVVSMSGETELYSIIISRNFCDRNNLLLDKLDITIEINDKKLTDMLKSSVDEFGSDKIYASQQLAANALSIVIHLLRNYSCVNKRIYYATKNDATTRIKRTVDYISEHYTEPANLEFLANMAGYTKNYYCNIFKQITNCTVIEYINKLRVINAHQLLSDGIYDVGQVAAMCGFDNPSYFSKKYKNYYHRLPSQSKNSKQNKSKKNV